MMAQYYVCRVKIVLAMMIIWDLLPESDRVTEWVISLNKLTRTSSSKESYVIKANKAVSSAGAPGSFEYDLLKS